MTSICQLSPSVLPIFRVISFKIHWFDLHSPIDSLKSLLQQQNSKASVLQHSVVFMAQLSYARDYWKNVSLDYMDLGQQKILSLLNML